MKHLFLFISVLAFFSFSGVSLANAQTCEPLYNGGVTNQQLCDNKITTPAGTSTKATPTPTPKIQTGQTGSTTKGGLPVLSSTATKTTPSTGPEALGIIALFPAGALGYYLRKRS